MQNNLRLPAGQHRPGFLIRFRGNIAGQHLIPRIAFVGMLVVAGIAADQLPRDFAAAVIMVMTLRFRFFAPDFAAFIQTAFVVPMAFAFLQAADQLDGLPVAFIRMYMLRADQLAPLLDAAFVRMGMDFRLRIAALGMGMRLNLRQRAPQIPASVITGGIMMMYDKIRVAADQIALPIIAVPRVLMDIQGLRGADRHPLLSGSHLGIAFLGMDMLGYLAPGILQRDGGQYQRVNRAEHHHAGKTGHHPVPESSSPVGTRVLFSG